MLSRIGYSGSSLFTVVVVAGPSELEHVPPLLMKASLTEEADWLDDPHPNARNSNGIRCADVKILDLVVDMKFIISGSIKTLVVCFLPISV